MVLSILNPYFVICINWWFLRYQKYGIHYNCIKRISCSLTAVHGQPNSRYKFGQIIKSFCIYLTLLLVPVLEPYSSMYMDRWTIYKLQNPTNKCLLLIFLNNWWPLNKTIEESVTFLLSLFCQLKSGCRQKVVIVL